MVQADEYKLTVINSKIGIRTQVSIFRKWRNDGYVSAALNNCTDFFFFERERESTAKILQTSMPQNN